MKTSRLILLAGLLAGGASFLSAGPGPQYWNRQSAPKPAPATVTPAQPETPAQPAVCSACACCKKT